MKQLGHFLQIIVLLLFIFSCSKEEKTGLALNEEWLQIPENAGGMGLTSFEVMKYEAKPSSAAENLEPTPVSIADNLPWQLSLADSKTECESLGENYHLISNKEWMAIARDIENIDKNWTGGTVGSGCLFRGNSGEETTGTGSTLGDSCGYKATPGGIEHGTERDLRSKHILSNGEEIFDLAGNVEEWTDMADSYTGPPGCPSSTGTELPDVVCLKLSAADYNTSNGTYTSSEGVGKFHMSGGFLGHSPQAGQRGGSSSTTKFAGVFALDIVIGLAPYGYSALRAGFRCVRRP